MRFFQKLYYFFSRYTDPAERRVGKFFARVNENTATHRIERQLQPLIQNDLAVINLWTEHRYKGYNYLTKRERKQLYENLAAIKADFADFTAKQDIDVKKVVEQIANTGADTSKIRTFPEKLQHIACIMSYLSPRAGRYEYRESSSFGRLLRNPAKEKLIGDCNQIVTLYLALYGEKYDVTDLKLTLYPGHVALHFAGVDIETTNGTFALYKKDGQHTAPVHEIVSVNLLDTTDTNFSKSSINPEVFLQAARLAYVVSGNRQLVKKNLEIAYSNAVRHMMKQQKHKQALTYAKQSKDHELIQIAAHNGAVHALKQKRFSDARRFATDASDKQGLLRTIDKNEAADAYNNKRYHDAISLYERLGERDMVKQCYRGLYNREQAKLKGVRTTEDLRAQAGTVRTMEKYARASGDSALVEHVASLTKYL